MLAIVAVLSLLGAAATLAQPLLVGQVIGLVRRASRSARWSGCSSRSCVASALLSGFQHYLLQRTGTAVVLSSRRS